MDRKVNVPHKILNTPKREVLARGSTEGKWGMDMKHLNSYNF